MTKQQRGADGPRAGAAEVNHMRHLVIGLCAFTVACSGATPTAPSGSLAPLGGLSSSADASPNAEQPRFNLEAVLRGDGFGLVKLRQHKDPTQDILYMDVWVRDLLPNTSYGLQRAVDSPQDGVCTGTNWLTMGQGTTPQPILTDDTGTGRAALWRPLPATVMPSDIHFRVIQTGTSNVALQSACYQLLLRD
jgi:hypothetical protein